MEEVACMAFVPAAAFHKTKVLDFSTSPSPFRKLKSDLLSLREFHRPLSFFLPGASDLRGFIKQPKISTCFI
jgi:hypothetical protein